MPNTRQSRRRSIRALCLTVILYIARLVLAQPDECEGTWRQPDLVELVKADSTIRLDIRYATSNNFMKRKMYTQARAFLQRPAAESLVRVHRKLKKDGYGVLVCDGYRPWSVTKKFWDETPQATENQKHTPRCARSRRFHREPRRVVALRPQGLEGVPRAERSIRET
jgi:D-alanyl-D-alanine dipeptidase